MTRPELLFVHGAWHGAWAFESLITLLASQGWKARAVDLPTSGSTVGREVDVAVVRASLAAHPAPTLVIGHSYGGAVISDACVDVPNVVGLAYLAAMVRDVGEPLVSGPLSSWVELDAPAGLLRALTPEAIFFGDVDPAIAARATARLVPHSLQAFTAPQAAAAWRHKPTSYLICQNDKAMLPEWQEAMSASIGHVERIAAGHSAFLSRPGQVAAFLARAADHAAS